MILESMVQDPQYQITDRRRTKDFTKRARHKTREDKHEFKEETTEQKKWRRREKRKHAKQEQLVKANAIHEAFSTKYATKSRLTVCRALLF
jgi:hypothetical protein